MDWSDEGIVLTTRRHGETSLIVELLTRRHGRHAGLVRGGTSRRHKAMLQPGNTLAAHWRARLEEHLGAYSFEPVKTRAAGLMSDRLCLAGLNAMCALTVVCLPEREAHERLYDAFEIVLGAMEDLTVWSALYVKWEIGLLRELGFGLDFSHCAATGVTDNLKYLSPKSGNAVSEGAAGPYKDRLFVIPAFLREDRLGGADGMEGILEGLKMTGYFIERRLLRPHGLDLPEARYRLEDLLRREAA
ncbi:MAG: DNA repair protein RecO [Alphaproteobacteria bacterium]|nr:MAG: DNA repair protein RecO [Alphaproteobacteria bacterium]